MRYAIAVAEERSFTRAAERCHVVQSALSHQIKALERELGTQLFARTSRRVEVTSAGEAFVASARESLAAAERAVAEAAATTGEVRGTLSVGVIPTVTAIDLPAVLGAFHRAHPHVHIHMRGGGSDQFIAAIAAGDLDVAVLGLHEAHVDRAGVATRLLSSERLVAVLPAVHPLAQRDALALRDLAGEVFVDFPDGTPGRVQSDCAFADAGLQRDVAFEAVSSDFMLELVDNGLVVALLPQAVVEQRPGLIALPVEDGPTRHEFLSWSSFNPSPAARALMSSLDVVPT